MRGPFAVYVLLMPFMSALAVTEILPLPLVFLVILAPFVISAAGAFAPDLRRDVGFFLAFALGCAAMLGSPIPLGSKNLNYPAAILVSYLMFFFVVRAWVQQPKITWTLVSTAAHLCLVVLSIAIIVEFYLASFHGIFYSDLIPFAHGDLNIADLVTADFKRPRAFAAEPGFTALSFECLWPLTFAGRRGRRVPGLHFLYGCAFSLLASAAAIASLSIALLVVWLVRSRASRGLFQLGSIVLFVAVVLGTTETGQEIAWSVIGRKFDLASFDAAPNDSAVTVVDRLTTYAVGLQLILSHPFGIGWGTLGQAFFTNASLFDVGPLAGSGMLSFYLDVAVASGGLGLLAFLFFVGRRVVGALRSKHPMAPYVAVALISLCIHHAVVTEFQFPFFWFALTLADKLEAHAILGVPVRRRSRHRHARRVERTTVAPSREPETTVRLQRDIP